MTIAGFNIETSVRTMKVEKPLSVRILTKNIRYATTAPFKGEEKWEVRRPYLINELRFNAAYCDECFICLQEVLHQQIIDIGSDLNKGDAWEYIGIGRDDGHQAGEYSPIFYRPSVWKLEGWDTVWLSRTPDKPSRSWDAASIRIVTIGLFKHYATGKRIIGMSTHLDDRGSRSRLEAAKIILQQIQKHLGPDPEKGLPIFLGGDFNSESDQEAYLEMTGDSSPMVDLRDLVSEDRQYGDTNTFSGFDSETRRKRIDFIFVNGKAPNFSNPEFDIRRHPKPPWMAQSYAVLQNRFEDGTYNSDHQAVVGDVQLL